MSPLGSPELINYGEKYIDTILHHYGKDLPAKSLLGEEITKRALISANITTERKYSGDASLKGPKKT